MRKIISLLFLFVTVSAMAQQQVINTTPFTRTLLRAADGPTAAAALGLSNSITAAQLDAEYITLQPYGIKAIWRAESFSSLQFTNGQSTNTWVDYVNGNALNSYQGSVTYNPNAVGGLPGLLLNSTTLTNANTFPPGTINSNCIIGVVWRQTDSYPVGVLECLLANTGPFWYQAGWYSIGPNEGGGGGFFSAIPGGTAAGVPLMRRSEVNVAITRYWNGQMTTWVNGDSGYDSAKFAAGKSWAVPMLTNSLVVGSYKDKTSPYAGYVAEVFILTNYAGYNDLSKMSAFYMTKYGTYTPPHLRIWGDSISCGYGPLTSNGTNLTSQLGLRYPGYTVSFVGYSGSHSGDIVTNSTPVTQMRPNEPNACMMGANDYTAHNPWTFTATNFILLCNIIHSNGGKFIGCTMISNTNETWDGGNFITNLNNWIRSQTNLFDAVCDYAASPLYGQRGQYTNGLYFEQSGVSAGIHVSNAWVYVDMAQNYLGPVIDSLYAAPVVSGLVGQSVKVGGANVTGALQSEIGNGQQPFNLVLDAEAEVTTNSGSVYSRTPLAQVGSYYPGPSFGSRAIWTNTPYGPGIMLQQGAWGDGIIDFGTNFSSWGVTTNGFTLDCIFIGTPGNYFEFGISTNGTGVNPAAALLIALNGGPTYFEINASTGCSSPVNLIDGLPHEVTCTYNLATKTAMMFADGALIAQQKNVNPPVFSNTNHFNVDASFNGTFLRGRAWSRAATTNEVYRIQNAANLSGKVAGDASGLFNINAIANGLVTGMPQIPAKAVDVHINTDANSDIGDDYALLLALAYDRAGYIKIRGISCTCSNQYIAPHIRALLAEYGRNDIAVGTNGWTSDGVDNGMANYVATNFWYKQGMLGSDVLAGRYQDSALNVMRKSLVAAGSNPLHLIEIGQFGNLSNLWTSPPDVYSSLSGSNLMSTNGTIIEAAAGYFPAFLGNAYEYNIYTGSNSAQVVNSMSNFPVRINWSGFSNGLVAQTGGHLFNEQASNTPIRLAQTGWAIGTGSAVEGVVNRYIWDSIPIVFTALGAQATNFFTMNSTGYCVVTVTGTNLFVTNSASYQDYYTVNPATVDKLTASIISMESLPPIWGYQPQVYADNFNATFPAYVAMSIQHAPNQLGNVSVKLANYLGIRDQVGDEAVNGFQNFGANNAANNYEISLYGYSPTALFYASSNVFAAPTYVTGIATATTMSMNDMILLTNATAPGNTTTIRAWVNITNSTGGTFKLPLYQ